MGSELTIGEDSIVFGGINLSASDLGGLTIGGRVQLKNPGGTALDLSNANVRSAVRFEPGQRTEGRIQLIRTTIHGRLNMRGVRLSGPEDMILVVGFGLRIDGAMQLDDLRAEGGSLDFTSATVSSIRLDDAVLSNGNGPTLSLERATVSGSVRLLHLVSQDTSDWTKPPSPAASVSRTAGSPARPAPTPTAAATPCKPAR